MSKGDVVFNIYHSRRAPQPPRKETHGIASLGAVNPQLIDKSWVLGQDYSMVEKALMCREGESVQVREDIKSSFDLSLFNSLRQPSFVPVRRLKCLILRHSEHKLILQISLV